MNFVDKYLAELDARGYQHDPEQRAVAERLEEIGQRLIELEARPRGLIGMIFGSRTVSTRGLYIHGGVGRGKTFLMDLFFVSAPIERKYRSHFHRFMRMVHDELASLPDTTDPLAVVAERLASNYRLICFDEFFVSDITDRDAASAGFCSNCSNAASCWLRRPTRNPPSSIATGCSALDSCPAIEAIEQHCDVVAMDGETDYRLELLESGRLYLTPADERANDELEGYFRRIAPGATDERTRIRIEGREIDAVRLAKGLAWFEFDSLCRGPRSQNDYIEIGTPLPDRSARQRACTRCRARERGTAIHRARRRVLRSKGQADPLRGCRTCRAVSGAAP